MKSCKDCKFFDVSPVYYNSRCSVFGYSRAAMAIREDDKACGFDAKWFEPKEEK